MKSLSITDIIKEKMIVFTFIQMSKFWKAKPPKHTHTHIYKYEEILQIRIKKKVSKPSNGELIWWNKDVLKWLQCQ